MLLLLALPHRLMDTLACTVRVFVCLSIKQVCSCFPECCLMPARCAVKGSGSRWRVCKA